MLLTNGTTFCLEPVVNNLQSGTGVYKLYQLTGKFLITIRVYLDYLLKNIHTGPFKSHSDIRS